MKSPTGIEPDKLVKSEDQTVVVGIGASAGGLEALEQFFKNMPGNSGISFVVIQHLDPPHIGILPELLQRITTMKVIQAIDRIKIMPDHVYVIPPNKSITMRHDHLYLSEPSQPRGHRLPVDIFFCSLANDRKDKSIGIILSGMGSDGSIGSKAIRENYGKVLVQDPLSAKFDGMPRNAIEIVSPDCIAPANELPGKLITFLKIPPGRKPVHPEEKNTQTDLKDVIKLLGQRTGHDFSHYKKPTLSRRIDRRKEIHQIEKVHDYVRFLNGNPLEIDILFKELLIGVTSFFRDKDVWEKLRQDILPGLLNSLPDKHIFRAWVPGCSSGEEAYSLAIILREALEITDPSKVVLFQIFATDLDHNAVKKARKGIFLPGIKEDVSPDRIRRYFSSESEGYRIKSSIREMIVFAEQNVTRDPPFTKLDMVSCRNLLIYMEQDLQKKLISLYHYSLNPNGILVLGTAENTGYQKDQFIELDSRLKIYKRSGFNLPVESIDLPVYQPKKMETKKIINETVENIQVLADQVVLQNYAPATVLVNEKGDIIYITGRTGKYLEPVAGKANWNIHAMAKGGLRNDLPHAFREALKRSEPVVLSNVKLGTDGDNQMMVDVTIQCLKDPIGLHNMLIVVFRDIPEKALVIPGNTRTRISLREKELESELKQTLENLISTREEMQTSQEELESTNEELQSTNGELQSTNEELTTSKEEMQSMNEELQTLNSELQSKVSDLTQVNNDMKNLFNSTEIATLFLDKEYNIRRFTDPVKRLFKLRTTDVGRPFTHIVSNMNYSEFEKHIHQVLNTLAPIETTIETNTDKWFDVRIMPYRTSDDRIDGLVITFVDVTLAKKLEFKLVKANEALKKEKKL